jgi:two-component system cell cycle response regulator
MESTPQSTPKADVLIVDDTPDNLKVLSRILQYSQYKVRAVTSGAMAISEARATPPDVIMLDISMPEMDGYETCRRLKADERTRLIPVIFLSAMDEIQDKLKAFEVGGVDYVTKPFHIDEVMARIETHLAIRQLQIQLEDTNRELAARLDDLSQSQEAERAQRILAEALRDTIAALNSTLNYEEVLDLVLANLARVVPHDAANIALLNEDGMIQIKRARGYEERRLEKKILAFSEPVDKFWTFTQAIHSKHPLVVPDTTQQPHWVHIPLSTWIRSFACAPIIVKGKVIGILNLDSAQPGFFTEEHARNLQTFADQAAVAIENARLYNDADRLAKIDGLTGLFNRRTLLEKAESEYNAARRYKHHLSLIMLDLDHFKKINDDYGHPMGDLALKQLATTCQKNLREVDIIGRYGGEEFLVVMKETTFDAAMQVAERIREQVKAIAQETDRGVLKMAISLGVATLEPGSEISLDTLITKADDALYAAKAAGRDRVCG